MRTAVLVLALAHGLSAQDESLIRDTVVIDSIPSQDRETALALLPVGEVLQYEARALRLRLGRASMEIMGVDSVRGLEAIHLQFLLEGRAMMYQLRNSMDSWIDVRQIESLRFVQDNKEGSRERRTEYEIFPDSGHFFETGFDTSMVTSQQPLDDAAFFYFVRFVELEPGVRYEFNNYFKPDRNPVVLEVLRRDTIEVPAGEFAVLEVRPIINGNGIFRENADARFWLTDDERRLPVKIQSKFSFATITLQLENLISPDS